jgi:hypothetical protein
MKSLRSSSLFALIDRRWSGHAGSFSTAARMPSAMRQNIPNRYHFA